MKLLIVIISVLLFTSCANYWKEFGCYTCEGIGGSDVYCWRKDTPECGQ